MKISPLIICILIINISCTSVQNSNKEKLETKTSTIKLKDTWALVKLSVAPMRSEDKFSSEMVSQAIMGTPIKILETKNEWYKIQSPEGYIGWMNSTGLEKISENQYQKWRANKSRLIVSTNESKIYSNPTNNSDIISDIVNGSILVLEEKTNKYYKVKLPDSTVGFISEDDCVLFEEWENKIDNTTNTELIKYAKTLLGTPYLWGGMSTKAMDCSGFTKTVFFSQGWILERDASQQVKSGINIDINKLESLIPGDLLFFGKNNNKITHVGIYIGNYQFIHSAGKVKINSLNPDHTNYAKDRHQTLRIAKRVLPLDKNPIKSIKSENSWYTN